MHDKGYIIVDGGLVATRALHMAPCRVALVGARDADEEALDWSFETAARLARAGIIVISGGARGVDKAAHEGALAVGGCTWCVLPCEPGTLYPPEHRSLYAKVRGSSGALIWAAQASPHVNKSVFHQRNAQLAALCTHMILVQAGAKSGTLGACAQALKLKRPVFSVVGAPWDARVAGCREAIRQGAHALVDSAQLEALFGLLPLQAALNASELPVRRPPDPILSALAEGPLTLEQLMVITGLSMGALGMRLLTLVGDSVVRDDLAGRYRLALPRPLSRK